MSQSKRQPVVSEMSGLGSLWYILSFHPEWSNRLFPLLLVYFYMTRKVDKRSDALTNGCYKLVSRRTDWVGSLGQPVQQPVVIAHGLLLVARERVHVVAVGPLASLKLELRLLFRCHLHHVVE